MKHKSLVGISVAAFMLAAPAYTRTILTPRAEADYAGRLAGQPEVAARLSLPPGLAPEERDAMRFLYAYLATPDVLDYDTAFYLKNVRLALKAAREMPWGDKVPDREWRHFVLPVRVNNENLDNSREVFYNELKPRVQGMSMEEAILEVNHWCHEKVSYQPSDARTSSPLATVANALGRCGEESTFTVAALRSVGIPARQVYTPRWAHTDDNHAWVEAWADGQWYFIGACEPEAVLNLAWFNAPASRGMLMTTKVTGAYDGPEEQLANTRVNTVINVTDNYAPVAPTVVFVTDSTGNPVENARVRFSLYNYAEFYPLAVKITDGRGRVSFTSGLGDMVVWAAEGDRFNLAKVHAGDTLRISLDKNPSFTGTLDFDLTPPAAGARLPRVSAEAAARNDVRKAYEDSVRLAYTATFPDGETALGECRRLGLDEACAPLIVKSRGNHAAVREFLRDVPGERRARAARLLGAVSEKDLHDITRDVLDDNMGHTVGDESSDLFVPYVLNPRVENEMLRPFRSEVLKRLGGADREAWASRPELIARFIDRHAVKDSVYNPEGYRQSVISTLDYGVATDLNKAIAFVSVCRSLGVPARIDPVSGKAQYAGETGEWNDVTFGPRAATASSAGKGVLVITDRSSLGARQPKYYSQFSLSRIEDDVPRLMEFDDFETLESVNTRREPLEPGQYLLVSGQRLADGTVLARATFFRAEAGLPTDVALTVRQDTTALQVIGSLDAESLYTPVTFGDRGPEAGAPRSILSTTGRGYYVLGVIAPGHEPSSHSINDIAAAADELAATGRTLLLLFTDADSAARFRPSDYGSLPQNVVFGIDGGTIVPALSAGLEMTEETASDMPLFVVADSFNRIVFFRHGYSINLGETLARVLRSVE